MALSGADVRRIYVQRAVSGAAPSEPFLDCYLDDGVQLLDEVSETELDEHLASADVVFTTFDAGRYTAGVDDDRARRRKGSVVHVTTSSFGTTGQYASWRGGPLADWAAGGYLFITGEPDKPPLIGPLHMCGYVTGFLAAVAAEAGLVRAARFGTGTHVDLSAMESMLSMHQSTFERVAAGV